MVKPKSYQTFTLKLTAELRARLPGLASKEQGGYEVAFARFDHAAKPDGDGGFVIQVSAEDLARLKKWAARPDDGTWQKWARDALAHNDIPA